MGIKVYSAKKNEVLESAFVSTLEAAAYMQASRGDRLAGFRKGMVQLALSGKQMTGEQEYNLHALATLAFRKDERLGVVVSGLAPKTQTHEFLDIGTLDLSKDDCGLATMDENLFAHA